MRFLGAIVVFVSSHCTCLAGGSDFFETWAKIRSFDSRFVVVETEDRQRITISRRNFPGAKNLSEGMKVWVRVKTR